MSKYEPSAELDENAEISWSSVYLYAEVMAHATSFTGADVIAAFNKVTTPITAGVMGTFLGSGTGPIPGAPQLKSLGYFSSTVNNGVITADGGFQKITGI